MVKDSISNLIISLKNASLQKKESVSVPYTKMTESVLETLKKEGYVGDLSKEGKDVKKTIKVDLKYEDGTPKIQEAKRISKFSKRVYKGSKEITPVRNGYGLLVLSTPEGILSGREAKFKKVGGEVLFEIW